MSNDGMSSGEMTHDELLKQLSDQNISPMDNTILAARMNTPPPPQVIGLAPAGAYDVFNGYQLSQYPVMTAFAASMPDPAQIPELKANFSSLSDLSYGEGPQNDLDIKPDGVS